MRAVLIASVLLLPIVAGCRGTSLAGTSSAISMLFDTFLPDADSAVENDRKTRGHGSSAAWFKATDGQYDGSLSTK